MLGVVRQRRRQSGCVARAQGADRLSVMHPTIGAARCIATIRSPPSLQHSWLAAVPKLYGFAWRVELEKLPGAAMPLVNNTTLILISPTARG